MLTDIMKKHGDKIRFLAVGGFNTIVDITILVCLTKFFGIDKYVSNIFSSSVAMSVSFYLNRKITFKDNSAINKTKILVFIGINIVGAWMIQPAVLFVTGLIHFSKIMPFIGHDLDLVICKCIAIGIALIWNYFMYRRFVFNGKEKD